MKHLAMTVAVMFLGALAAQAQDVKQNVFEVLMPVLIPVDGGGEGGGPPYTPPPPDTTPPNAFTIIDSGRTTNEFSISFVNAGDGVTGYDVYVNVAGEAQELAVTHYGAPAVGQTGTLVYYTACELTVATLYQVQVVVRDAAGNETSSNILEGETAAVSVSVGADPGDGGSDGGSDGGMCSARASMSAAMLGLVALAALLRK